MFNIALKCIYDDTERNTKINKREIDELIKLCTKMFTLSLMGTHIYRNRE